MVLSAVTQRYSCCFTGSTKPVMEICSLIERYHHIEYIYYKFGPWVKTPLCYFYESLVRIPKM